MLNSIDFLKRKLNINLTETNSLEESQGNNLRKTKIKKILLFIGGTISLILGSIGIVVPILPTTPFLLLAAACYAISSERFYNWLINNKVFGYYIRNYKEGKGMPLKLKIFTITLLWVTILLSVFLFVTILLVQILLLIIAIAVTVHIILIRPKNQGNKEDTYKLKT